MPIILQTENLKSDLEIILLAATGGKPIAMTEGADRELHELLDGRDTLTFDNGEILVHVPDVYGTLEFGEAWKNTCKAFADHGIHLTTDYLSDRGHPRSAAACFITLRPAAH